MSITTTIRHQNQPTTAARFGTKVVFMLIATFFLTLTVVKTEVRLDALPSASGFAADLAGE